MNRPIEIIEELENLKKEMPFRYDVDYRKVEKLLDYTIQLEKALDKACDTLTKFMPNALSQTKEQWKEYLLKESRKICSVENQKK